MFFQGGFILVAGEVRAAALSDQYRIKRFGVMAALAISAELPVVYIILAVAIRTPG